MRSCRSKLLTWFTFCALLPLGCQKNEPVPAPQPTQQTYAVTGIVTELKLTQHQIRVRHEEVADFMPAMTMPFTVHHTNDLPALSPGDKIWFRLLVTEDESWIEDITKIAAKAVPVETSNPARTDSISASGQIHPLLTYNFTNEFGHAVTLHDFSGQAIGLTFFFTRCPLPEYCPRLMKNFAGAAAILRTNTAAPTNWHFLAITFDPAFDTPEVLRNYAAQYRYDSNHWSFLTGASNHIAELSQAFGVYYEPDGAFFNHNFRTLVINAAGQLQTTFPIGGDLSELLATEMLRATAGTNP